jgi:hypothetical protein
MSVMIPIHPDQKERENRDADGHWQTAFGHCDVEKHNIKDDWAEDDQAEHREEIEQEEQPSDDLKQKNHFHVTCGRDGGEEHSGRTLRRWQWAHGDEMEKAIEAKNDKDEAQQGARNDGGNFHG